MAWSSDPFILSDEEGASVITVSLCMIVRDEEAVLERCLESVRDAVDEIIIVDTGSTDGTKDIGRKYTGKIYDLPWQDDFAAARNFAFFKGTMDYLMWLMRMMCFREGVWKNSEK